MIITRRKFEEAMTKARCEAEERVWHDQRLQRIEDNMWRELQDIRERLNKLEHPERETLCEEVRKVVFPK